jgi:hypothetical protein
MKSVLLMPAKNVLEITVIILIELCILATSSTLSNPIFQSKNHIQHSLYICVVLCGVVYFVWLMHMTPFLVSSSISYHSPIPQLTQLL